MAENQDLESSPKKSDWAFDSPMVPRTFEPRYEIHAIPPSDCSAELPASIRYIRQSDLRKKETAPVSTVNMNADLHENTN